MKASLATVAIALLALAGCGGDDGGADDGGDDPGSSASAPEETTGAPAGDLSSYETVSDLNDALAAGGIDCTLEYEGLVDADKEISQCTIEGSQAFLTIWFDESLVTEIVAPEGLPVPAGVAYGQNWTVELTSADPTTATAIADAAGGAVTEP